MWRITLIARYHHTTNELIKLSIANFFFLLEMLFSEMLLKHANQALICIHLLQQKSELKVRFRIFILKWIVSVLDSD